MVAATSSPRLRRRDAGPEAELVDAALRARIVDDGAIVWREPQLATGYPDIVAVVPARAAERHDKRPTMRLEHLRLVHFLCMASEASLAVAATTLRQSPTALERLAAELHTAGVIRRRGDRLRVSLSRAFVATRIIAIEAKISKWREALVQASANAWFASHSYVLLPSVTLAERALEEATLAGVGVMALDGERVLTVLRPRVRSIPASLGSWIVHEWMIERLRRG